MPDDQVRVASSLIPAAAKNTRVSIAKEDKRDRDTRKGQSVIAAADDQLFVIF
ncbi:hypothetical protein AMC90_CH02828 [Rhizobium phaseoli]|uniref:hypothetical protein n=1 Tax=Rhizobium phaseoli TaxID=396 RepID=UPI0007F13B1B|nr:hypothetical protein [Rhizobium phaseoli]ANL28629.1 hypothetical protein AMC90_CH02828 [Rhizobium phaseoli]ANM04959.1 hypothetical protein AMC78_CH02881 [Rhizobium phaseoli]